MSTGSNTKTAKPPKTLISAMIAFEKAVKGPMQDMQDDYMGVLADKPVDIAQASELAGQLYVFMLYDRFFDHVRATCGFVDKALVQKQLGQKLTEADFDEWVAEAADWFKEEGHLPDRARDFPVLMQLMDETVRSRLQDDDLIEAGLAHARVEFPKPGRDAFIEGMETNLDWIATTVVPGIVPDAPAPTQSAQAVHFKMPGLSLS